MYGPNFFPYPSYNMMNAMAPTRGLGFLRRLGTGSGLFRNINWGTLFSNTSRALGVINQAIPIVKQAGPMFNNMRSILKVASAFKDVTDNDKKSNNNIPKKDTSNTSTLNNNNNYNNNYQNNYETNNITTQTNDNYNYNYYNTPNFFI